MKKFLEEFKAFAVRGNVIDLAVAVIIGGAFGKITTSLVNNIVMPIFGMVLGGIDFTDKTLAVGDASIAYGIFIQSIIEFVIIAFAIFLMIKLLSKIHKKQENDAKKEEKAKSPSEEVLLLREIRDSVRK
jgi:large conductance mechanosensitive channel